MAFVLLIGLSGAARQSNVRWVSAGGRGWPALPTRKTLAEWPNPGHGLGKRMVLGSLLSSLGTVFAAGVFIADIIIACGVYQDAEKLYNSASSRLRIFSPGQWAIICLFGSIPALAIYWVAHHSTFSK